MKSRTVTVKYKEGLHARPASHLTSLCAKFASDFKLAKGSQSIDPKSILGIMMLGATYGESLELTVDGADEGKAMDAILEFFEGEAM